MPPVISLRCQRKAGSSAATDRAAWATADVRSGSKVLVASPTRTTGPAPWGAWSEALEFSSTTTRAPAGSSPLLTAPTAPTKPTSSARVHKNRTSPTSFCFSTAPKAASPAAKPARLSHTGVCSRALAPEPLTTAPPRSQVAKSPGAALGARAKVSVAVLKLPATAGSAGRSAVTRPGTPGLLRGPARHSRTLVPTK